MKVLCVDTATRNNWVGLYVDNRITDCIGYEDRQSCLINLIPSIELLLKNAGLEISALDAVITVTGPGAWSSLRIGIATVKQLCLVNQIPLIDITTLDLIAETALRTGVAGRDVLAVLNAQSNKVYAAQYAITNKQKSRISPYQWEDVQRLSDSIASDTTHLQILGDGADLFEPYKRESWQLKEFIPQQDSAYLNILGEIASAQKPVYKHEGILLLKPLYIQPSSAEVEFKVSVT
jgi:tRNA threonylcarbamoyladenosine biosynthesis protein TsaB